MIHRHVAHLAGHVIALQIDRDDDIHLAGVFENQRDGDLVTMRQLAVQAHEHHVVAAAFQHMGVPGRDLEAFLDLDHAHHIAIGDMGVQLDPLGHVRARGTSRSSSAPVFWMPMKAAPDCAMGDATRA